MSTSLHAVELDPGCRVQVGELAYVHTHDGELRGDYKVTRIETSNAQSCTGIEVCLETPNQEDYWIDITEVEF